MGFAGAVAAAAAFGVTAPAGSAGSDSLSRAPHCTEVRPAPQPDVKYGEGAYRRVLLKRSWLRVGARLGVGFGPGDPGGACGAFVCTPIPPPPHVQPGQPYPVGVCGWKSRPPSPGPQIAVNQLRAFRPEVALSEGGSSRAILIAEGLCRGASSEKALLRCLRANSA
jgi:hypothetical protein